MQEFTIKQTILDYRSKEAFKTLRTNIEFSGEDTKVIFLTSTTPNEGKSTVSFELAQSFAQNVCVPLSGGDITIELDVAVKA